MNSLPKSPKKDDDTQANFTSRLTDTVMSPFSKGKGDQKLPRERTANVLKIYQRVVTFIGDIPTRGAVRYVGEEKESNGFVRTIVGLELVSTYIK